MPYHEQLADRVRNVLGSRKGFIEQKMFGGLCFMVRGNMCCGIVKDDLMVRVGPDRYEQLLAEPHARPMDFTGRAMKGFVYVGPEGYRSDQALARWVKRGVDFALSLPANSSIRHWPDPVLQLAAYLPSISAWGESVAEQGNAVALARLDCSPCLLPISPAA